jgi:hypothetical protein
MMRPPRPVGISILAILELLFGALAFIFGAILAASSGFIDSYAKSMGLGSISSGALGTVLAIFGGALVVGGLIAILIGWGLWTGRGWARIIAIILSILGVIGGLATVVLGVYTGIVSLLIDLLILWYLFRPNVRAYFSKSPPAPMAQPSATTT